ncbi:MAG: hypothetical protein KDC53_20485, partial [Saprospiraceae bacterium]|nr:hypothetical protein [Saprospiraceae bacterium]
MSPFIFLILLVSCNKYSRLEPSAILSELSEKEKVARSYFFYPSIMRMVNLQDNPSFNEMIKKVEKVILYRLKREVTLGELTVVRNRLEQEEAFEDYARVSLQGKKMFFLGKENPDHSVFIIPSEREYYVADVMGQINFIALNKMIQLFSAEANNENKQFLDIISLVGGQR